MEAQKKIALMVTGTRNAGIAQLRWVNWAINKVRVKYPDAAITLVHGDAAKGVDRHAGAVAEHLGIRVHKMPADWDRYGKSAGFRRNDKMVRSIAACSADIKVCIGFPLKLDWDTYQGGGEPKQSRGTIHAIKAAQEAGLKTWVVPLSIQEPPTGPKAKVRVRGAGEARVSSQEDDGKLASWSREKSETRYQEKVDAPEGRAVYSVPDTGYEWVRQPNGSFWELYEGEVTRKNLTWYEVKKWLNPDMWE